ncbi:MAG TPA: sigma-70 family RNA polymerase sigma factor [Ignavibacteriaceae bacterium]|nr:sigma-70 family RNA polymerase sigma factor [Ignavibacteriaceae bacterium]
MSFRKNKNDLQFSTVVNNNDDFSLIQKFNEGEESAYSTLVTRHKEKVRNIIFVTMGNLNSVDDIAQDVFLIVYKNLSNFRFESQFTTWLYRITVNKCRDQLRKNKIRSIIIPLKDSDSDASYTPSTEKKEVKEIVRKAISKLPDKLRIPLMLKDIEGFSYQEIADFVECEIGTVKSRIFRARENLKTLLKPYEKELMQ